MELLIRIVDKGSDPDASKRGDVIVTNPDGWDWSDAEKCNPDWVIVRAPITAIAADGLVNPVLNEDGGIVSRRKYSVDIGDISGSGIIDLSLVQIESMVSIKS